MTLISDKIRYFRKKNNLTLAKLAQLSTVGQSTINDLETGKAKNPKFDTLKKLANALNVDVNEFFDEGLPITKKDINDWDYKLNTNQLSKELSIYDSINVNKSNITNIPILGTVRAGEPMLTQENITGYNPVLNKFISRDKQYFYLKVQGDSMNQEFNEGDLLLIEQTDYIENGDIAVVLIDGQEATVKKVIKNENMVTLIPMSTNPRYVPKMYDVVKDEIKIIGKVIQATKIY